MKRDRKRPQLIRPARLLIMAGCFIVALVLLFPRQEDFEKIVGEIETGEVSSAHLRLMLRANPEDHRIRILLAKQLLALNRLDEVDEVLAPLLLERRKEVRPGWLLAIDAISRRLGRLATNDPTRSKLIDRAEELILVLISQELGASEMTRLTELASPLGRPDLMVAIYKRRAEQSPAHRAKWWAKAAEVLAATQRGEAAAELYAMSVDVEANTALARLHAVRAVEALRAADKGVLALTVVERYLGRFPDEPSLLHLAVVTALSEGEPKKAARWGTLLVKLHPADTTTLIQQVARELGAGNPREAKTYAERIVALLPNDPLAHERLARIAEWTTDPALALANWSWLARRSHQWAHIANAIRLARATWTEDVLLEMLLLSAYNRRLSAEELTEIVKVLERQGNPEQARRLLEKHLETDQIDRENWEALVHIYERVGDPSAALASRAIMSERFGRTIDDARLQAELLWKLGRPHEAMRLVWDNKDFVRPDDSEYWRLTALLTAKVGSLFEALHSHRQLWKTGKATAEDTERLIKLAEENFVPEEAIQVAQAAYARFGIPGFLVMAMEAAWRSRNFGALDELVKIADAAPKLFEKNVDCWIYRAANAKARGRMAEAQAAYFRALALDPNLDTAREDFLWILMERKEWPLLGEYMARWRNEAWANPRLWEVYATAYVRLGQPEKALPWFERQLPERAKDYLWMLLYYDALVDSKNGQKAWRLRKHVVAKLEPQVRSARRNLQDPTNRALILDYTRAVSDAARTDDTESLLRELWKSAPEDDRVREVALSWYLARGRAQRARELLKRAKPSEHLAERFTLAIMEDDRTAMAQLLAKSPRVGTPADQIVALTRLGEDERALEVAVKSLSREPESGIVRMADELILRLPRSVSALVETQSLGPLRIDGVSTGLVRFSDDMGLRARASLHNLQSTEMTLRTERELEAALGIRLRSRHAFSEATLAARLAWGDKDMFSAEVVHERQLGHDLDARVELAINEVTSESPLMRVFGVRDRLAIAADWQLSLRISVGAELDLEGYFTRGRETLGVGARAHTQLSFLVFDEPKWIVRLTASSELRALVPEWPSDVAGYVPHGVGVDDMLLPRAAALGVGTTFSLGNPGAGPIISRSLRYFADLWTGWLFFENSLAYNVRLGFGMPLLGRDELSLGVALANTQGSAWGGAQRALSVQYMYRFWP